MGVWVCVYMCVCSVWLWRCRWTPCSGLTDCKLKSPSRFHARQEQRRAGQAEGGVDTRHRDSLHLCVCVGSSRRHLAALLAFDLWHRQATLGSSRLRLRLWLRLGLVESWFLDLVFIIFIAPHWVEEMPEPVASLHYLPLQLPLPLQQLFICSHPSLLRAGSSFCLRVFRVVHLTFRRANRSSHLGIILIDFQSERGLSLRPPHPTPPSQTPCPHWLSLLMPFFGSFNLNLGLKSLWHCLPLIFA